MADDVQRAEPTHQHETGALASIESLIDVPKRLLEAIMEGLAKEPSKWMVIALGFYLGYKGIDVLKYFITVLKGIAGAAGAVIDDLTKATLDVTLIPLLKFDPAKFLLSLFGGIGGPKAAKDDAPPTTPAKPVTSEDLADDPGVSSSEVWMHELEARLVAGAMGALVAVVVTGPGFLSGLGEIVKGIGEIVPG